MVSRNTANNYIKQILKMNEKIYNNILKRYESIFKSPKELEVFLADPDRYTVSVGIDRLIEDATNNIKTLCLNNIKDIRFSQPAQKALFNTIISERVGVLMTRPESLAWKTEIGNIIRDNSKKAWKDISKEIQKQTNIGKSNADRIARTEEHIARTNADYIVSKKRGADEFEIVCHDPCEYCQDFEGKTFDIDDTDNLPPYHPNCYNPETEVFTNNGWKLIKNVNINKDKVLTLNPDTKITEFIKPKRLIQHKNNYTYMYHIYNNSFDICVTPDHDCFIYQKRDGGKKGKYYEPQFRKPNELNNESKFLRTVENNNVYPEYIDVNDLKFTPEDYAFFMAWYISEGNVLHNYETAKNKNFPIKISQTITENRKIIKPVFEKIADYLGIKLYIGESYFEFHSKELYEYLLKLGESNEKYIPSEVFSLDKKCLNIFLDNYVLGDGHERKRNKYNSIERTVFTSSIRLRDDLSYIILLCGYYPSIYLHTQAGKVVGHRNGVYTQNYDVWGLRINTTKHTSFGSCNIERINYGGEVVCLELPKFHTLWVKYNGKTSWNGNCRCSAIFKRKKKD